MNSCWKMKIQNEKPLGHSASRSSNISKAGSPTSVNAPCSFSRTSVSPSSQDICSSRSEDHKQTAVVLLNGGTRSSCSGSGGLTVATLCADALPAAPKPTKQRDWRSLIFPPSVGLRPPGGGGGGGGSLRFSVSLNDVGQRVDSLCRGLRFIDRTCSEGELELKPPAPPPPSDAKSANGYIKYPSAVYSPDKSGSAHIPPPPPPPPPPPSSSGHHLLPRPPRSASGHFLRLLLPFSRSSTSTSELGSYASHLHMALPSPSEAGFPLGGADEDEEAPPRHRAPAPTGLSALPAPLCYMDEDSDLDRCPSPITEKCGPQSPHSLSGDCCRWVTGPGWCPHHHASPSHSSCDPVESRQTQRALWSCD